MLEIIIFKDFICIIIIKAFVIFEQMILKKKSYIFLSSLFYVIIYVHFILIIIIRYPYFII